MESTVSHSMSAFQSEAALVEQFVRVLGTKRTFFGKVDITTEWDHKAGLVDVLALDRSNSLIAFEAKLADWKRAFHQAYRNTAYANRAYVLLPANVAHRALRNREEFEYRGIGLCCFDGSEVEVLVEASEQEPLLEWVRRNAHKHFGELLNERRSRSRTGCHTDLSPAIA